MSQDSKKQASQSKPSEEKTKKNEPKISAERFAKSRGMRQRDVITLKRMYAKQAKTESQWFYTLRKEFNIPTQN